MPLSLVWFKRDLRVHDHAALTLAAERGRVLPLYIWEDEQLTHPEYSSTQLTLTNDALAHLSGDLARLGAPLHVRHGEAASVIAALQAQYGFTAIYAHQETGKRRQLRPRPPRARLGPRAGPPLSRTAAERRDPPPTRPEHLGGRMGGPHGRPAAARPGTAGRSGRAALCAAPATRGGPPAPHADAPLARRDLRGDARPRDAAQLPDGARRELHARDEFPAERRARLLAPQPAPHDGHRQPADRGARHPATPRGRARRRRHRPALAAVPAHASRAACTGTATSCSAWRASRTWNSTR